MSAPLKSPNKRIKFFDQFPKNFLQPHGEATQAPDEHKIFQAQAIQLQVAHQAQGHLVGTSR